MEPINEPCFAVSDRINDVAVGLKHVPLALLGEFQKDVSEFLKGSGRDVDPAQVLVSVEDGSLAFEAHQPSYDEDEFKRMVERGTQAWSDVPNSAAWVESLRGGKACLLALGAAGARRAT